MSFAGDNNSWGVNIVASWDGVLFIGIELEVGSGDEGGGDFSASFLRFSSILALLDSV